MIAILRLQSLSAASPVTGPFAASTITLQFIESTLFELIALPRAAGMKKSHLRAEPKANPSICYFFPHSLNPSIVRCFLL